MFSVDLDRGRVQRKTFKFMHLGAYRAWGGVFWGVIYGLSGVGVGEFGGEGVGGGLNGASGHQVSVKDSKTEGKDGSPARRRGHREEESRVRGEDQKQEEVQDTCTVGVRGRSVSSTPPGWGGRWGKQALASLGPERKEEKGPLLALRVRWGDEERE